MLAWRQAALLRQAFGAPSRMQRSVSTVGPEKNEGSSPKGWGKRTLIASSAAAGIGTGVYILSQSSSQDKVAMWLLHRSMGRSLLINSEPTEPEHKTQLRQRAAQTLANTARTRAGAQSIVDDPLLLDAVLLSANMCSTVPESIAHNQELVARRQESSRVLLATYLSFWEALVSSKAYTVDHLISLGLYQSVRATLSASPEAPQLDRVASLLASILTATNDNDNDNNGNENDNANNEQKLKQRFRELAEYLGFDHLQLVLQSTPLDNSFRLQAADLCPSLSKTVVDATFLADHGLSFLLSLPISNAHQSVVDSRASEDLAHQLWSNVIKSLGNMAHVCPEIARQLLSTATVETVLLANIDLPETARCIANLSRAEHNKPELVAHKWPKHIARRWLSSHAVPQVKLAALITINNLARQPELASDILEQISVNQLVSVCEQHANDRVLASALVRVVGQIFVSLAHSSPDRLHKLLCRRDGHESNALHRLMSLVEQQQDEWPTSIDFLATSKNVRPYQFITRTLGYIADSPDPRVAESLLSDARWWRLIMDLTSIVDDIDVSRETARTIANIVSRAENPALLKAVHDDLLPLLGQWTHSSDVSLSVDAIRAQASLFQHSLQSSKYVDGIYLLHPTDIELGEDDRLFDIVFIHGVTGHFLGTWKVGDPAEEDNAPLPLQAGSKQKPAAAVTPTPTPTPTTTTSTTTTTPDQEQQSVVVEAPHIWAKDWIPEDFPESRVISISYEVQISGWFGKSLPLKEQAKQMLTKLRLGALGSRPVIFICHSFGGLLVKEMLMDAQNNPDFKPIADKTIGVAFYATPHRGAEISRLSENPVLDRLVRSTDVVYDLHPENEQLSMIHQYFADNLASSISTLSFGESRETCIASVGSRRLCLEIVPVTSANPGFLGPNHSFFPLPHNHRSICKPVSKDDERYTHVIQWISSLVAPLRRAKEEAHRMSMQGMGEVIDELTD